MPPGQTEVDQGHGLKYQMTPARPAQHAALLRQEREKRVALSQKAAFIQAQAHHGRRR
jgi:hypothetical protein